MAKQNLIAALDIGGGKITAVAATVDQQKNVVKILAGNEFRCEGLEGGIVTDIRGDSCKIDGRRITLTPEEKATIWIIPQ